MMRISGWLIAIFMLAQGLLWSEENGRKLSTNRLFWSGYAHTWYQVSQEDEGKNTFRAAAFPIYHYRVGDKLHFTGELELEMDEEGASVGIETAEANVFLSNNFTLTAGRFFTPVGVFIERLHPSWINKLHSGPLPFTHGNSLVPFTQVGVKLKGVFPISGYSKITADFFVSNGVSTSTGTATDGHHGGSNISVDFEDSNKNKAVGARIGLIPFKWAEIGVSLMSSKVTQKFGDDVISDKLDYRLWGVDAEYHGEVWEIRGEYINSSKDKIHDLDEGEEIEKKDGFYIQAATRLSIIPAGFYTGALTPWEIAVRYSAIREEDGTGGKDTTSRLSFGLNYYITTSASAKMGYDVNKEPNNEVKNDVFTIMLAIGF